MDKFYVVIYYDYHYEYIGTRAVTAKGVFRTFEDAVDFVCNEAELDEDQRKELEENEQIEVEDAPICKCWMIDECEYEPGEDC